VNVIFEEILREVDKNKLAARRKLAARKALLYERLPRVKEIDDSLSQSGLALAQMALKKYDNDDKIAEIRDKSTILLSERKKLLYDNGYDDSFFKDVYKCQSCLDTGFTNDEHCNCLKQRLITRYFDMSNLGKIFADENFDAFNMNYYSDTNDENFGISPRKNMMKVWEIALNFVEDFGKNFENLLFYGQSGLGKTFLTNCIAGELLQNGRTVLYTTAPQLFRHVEDERFNRKSDKNAAPISFAYDADLLIIDDLGSEFATVVTDSELFSFINSRHLAKKPTIISTNLTPTDIATSYSDRVASRIYGNYTSLHFFGDDIRIAKKHNIV